MSDLKRKTLRKRVLKHLGNVCMAIVSFSLITSPVSVVDPSEVAHKVIGSEDGQKAAKEALDTALKVVRSKPALTTATTIVCLACVPVDGAAASPGMFIACGILIAKTFG